MPFDPQKHHRRSTRLKGYDYARPGAYFVTVVCHDRACVLGGIIEGEMQVNTCGEIVRDCWNAIPRHFPGVDLDLSIVMPNHIHGIVMIRDNRRGEAFGERPTDAGCTSPNASPLRPRHGPQGTRPGSLPAIVQNFKSVSTRRINQQRAAPGIPVWQRNYYERIIRNDAELDRIRLYIAENPHRWAKDDENPMLP